MSAPPPPSSAIPSTTTVLVIGGGPGGSYAASALAREGLSVVLLEAEHFPRYHVGESMLASMRHLLRFVDADAVFDRFGFTKKVGAAFKLNGRKREGYTDFLAAGGPENYAWNVVRSQADDLLFQHARACGAQAFDGVKVGDIVFEGARPVSATWSRKPSGDDESETGTGTGSIEFEYLVDASGRAGVLSTRYLKTRSFNQGLKNVASWGYWSGAGVYARGTARANSPFFEALQDESGWAWLIPLHDGTASVGVVMNQEIATAKKKAVTPSPSARDFYLEQLKLAPSLLAILHSIPSPSPTPSPEAPKDSTSTTPINSAPPTERATATLITDIKSASDYSYSSTTYSCPHARIVGDAGCFIDPYFSSGVHLALTSALSAAVTICASLRADCPEAFAQRWHDVKVGTGYTRFLMVVLSAYKQIRRQEEPVLADFDEDNFDRAFAFFRPIIQGTADVSNKLSHEELKKTLDFCAHAFEPTLPEDRASVMEKLNGNDAVPTSATATASSTPDGNANDKQEAFNENLSTEEQRVLKHIRARTMMRTEDTMNIASFTTDVIEGFAPHLQRGALGLRKVSA